MSLEELSHMRMDYEKGSLEIDQVHANPFRQFEAWFDQALNSQVREANAMVLATVQDERPSQRVVLLKGFDDRGLMFFTNYESRKGQELAKNPFASVCFYWDHQERQVRIEGQVEKASEQESDTYFQSRGRGSRIGAWASPQSQPLSGRNTLEDQVAKYEASFQNQEQFPRPPHWGGYRLLPDYFEFWQGRKSRLHDRIFYRLHGKEWEIGRLAP